MITNPEDVRRVLDSYRGETSPALFALQDLILSQPDLGIDPGDALDAARALLAAHAGELTDAPVMGADTLPQWLYQRFARYRPGGPENWADVTDDGRAYWKHEAAAVRRAVARGGFKAAEGGGTDA